VFHRLLLVSAIAVMSALLVACGDDDDDDGSTAAPTVPAEETAASGDGGAAAAEQVNMIDFGFEPSSLSATAGEEVTLELTNSGELPHTFTIDGLVDSMEVPAGESATISFTPSEAGTLTFFCTIHGAATMSGELTVN
jgi:plastocyanin